MIDRWLKSRRIFFVLGALLLASTGLLLYWLYLGSIEREKVRLMDLALLHVQQLETIRKIEDDGTHRMVGHSSDRMKEIFSAQAEYHRFGETGKIIFIEGGHLRIQSNIFDQQKATMLFDEPVGTALVMYAPFAGRDFGVAATVDLQEIRLPYLQAAVGLGFMEFLAMLLSGMLTFYRKGSDPPNTQENEATSRAILASAGEGIVTFNEYSQIETFNEAAESMFFYLKDEIIGQSFQTLFVSSDHNPCDTFLLTYRAQGTTQMSAVVKEFQAQRKDGTVFPLTLTLTEAPIWGHRLFTVLLRDMTEQKMAERRLAAQYAVAQVLAECMTIHEATPEILRAVCESIGWQVGILWQVDADVPVLCCVEIWQASPDRFSRFVKMTQEMSFSKGVGLPGRTWEEAQPVWITDAVHDSNFPRAPMASEEGLHAAFAFPIQLGSTFFGVMEFFSREIQAPDQALLHQMLSVGSQIGQFMQRKNTEMALRESEEQIRMVLDTALDAVLTFRENGDILSWNSQAERMFGWSREQILGQSLVETVIPLSYREGYLEGLQQFIRTGLSQILNHRTESFGLHRDGHEVPSGIFDDCGPFKRGNYF